MAEWERVEGKAVSVSYVATFADMARAVLRSDLLAEWSAQDRAEELRAAADAFGHWWQADMVHAPAVYSALRRRAAALTPGGER